MATDDMQDMGGEGWSAPQDDVAGKLSDLARSLQREDSEDAVLEQLVCAALTLVPGADEGSITLVLGRRRVGPVRRPGISHGPSTSCRSGPAKARA